MLQFKQNGDYHVVFVSNISAWCPFVDLICLINFVSQNVAPSPRKGRSLKFGMKVY